ncbi:unnamed protein product, partial [Cyprideis torosa]
MVEADTPLYESNIPAPTDAELKVGEHVANLVEDGATLQMGIGSIPNVVLEKLEHHQRLGIHTEMFSDGIIPLVKLKNTANGAEMTYTLVPESEADLALGKISVNTPIAKGLL